MVRIIKKGVNLYGLVVILLLLFVLILAYFIFNKGERLPAAVTQGIQITKSVWGDNLVAYWPFTSSMSDVSGNSNNLTSSPNTAFVDFGVSASALSLNKGYASRSSINNAPRSVFTELFWIKNVSSTASITSSMFDHQVVTWVDTNSGVNWLNWGIGLTTSGGKATWKFTGMIGNLDDKWHHVAILFNGASRTIKVYFDGVFAYERGIGLSYIGTPASVYFGTPPGIIPRRTDFAPFGGILDDAMIFGRALTDTDIAGIYNEQKTILVEESLSRKGCFSTFSIIERREDEDSFFTLSVPTRPRDRRVYGSYWPYVRPWGGEEADLVLKTYGSNGALRGQFILDWQAPGFDSEIIAERFTAEGIEYIDLTGGEPPETDERTIEVFIPLDKFITKLSVVRNGTEVVLADPVPAGTFVNCF